MAWTTPRTWVTSELVTAAMMNTDIRDNINFLYTQVASQFMLSARGGWPSTTLGCGGATQTEFTTNDVDLWSSAFDPDAALEHIQWSHPLPSDYDGGVVTAIFYWFANDADTDDVRWRIQAQAFDESHPLDGTWGTSKFIVDSNNADADLNISDASGDLTIANTPAAGDLVSWRASRTGSDGLDSLDSDAELLHVVITYTRV